MERIPRVASPSPCMNPVPLFLIIVTLPLLLGGCGEEDKKVESISNNVRLLGYE